jgi:virginiamycin A acetyltransferase
LRIYEALKHNFNLAFGQKTDSGSKPKIIIPYGRHSYGPQPELLGFMPYLLRKARGSKVGNFCSISPGLKFSFLGKHSYDCASTYPFYNFFNEWKFENSIWHEGKIDETKIEAKPIIIENDVWIACNVKIKEGVRICNGAVVAMESLVTKNVPPYALVGGNPAKIIKYRFDPEQINELQEIAWWNWNDEKIKEMIPLLRSKDVDSFITAAKNRR